MHNYAPLRVNSTWAVSLSQLCATQCNTGLPCCPMLVHGGACNTSLSLALPKDYRFKSSQPHGDALTPGPPKQNKCNVTQWLRCTGVHHEPIGFFSKKKGFLPIVRWQLFLLATDEVHTQPVSIKHFCLKNRFFASLIIETLSACLLVSSISEFRTQISYPKNPGWEHGTHPCLLVEEKNRSFVLHLSPHWPLPLTPSFS